jgi:molybdopterin synthase sulfur carrier subunit
MSSVRIPPVLRTSTGGQKVVEIPGETVGAVLANLVASHPGLGGQIFGEAGDLNRFMNVFLNDTDIRHLEILETAVDERDSIVLLPAMAGGSIGGEA